ncbi:unnamed protein product [Enterobius vermicularis]|uniref:Clathrin light chain n=1 Tax=Enterobius vermicularis TaxID=51028 RepID=A0A0N4VPC0_ENTVE|nr:unnamed protein product [Enterobius vermicularis]
MSEPVQACIEVWVESLREQLEKFQSWEAAPDEDSNHRRKNLMLFKKRIEVSVKVIKDENKKWSEILADLKGPGSSFPNNCIITSTDFKYSSLRSSSTSSTNAV